METKLQITKPPSLLNPRTVTSYFHCFLCWRHGAVPRRRFGGRDSSGTRGSSGGSTGHGEINGNRLTDQRLNDRKEGHFQLSIHLLRTHLIPIVKYKPTGQFVH